jgi:hypothetical protein
MSELQDKVRELQQLRAEQSVLLDKLARSVALKEFIPDAFDHGPCRSYVTGNLFRPREMRFVVELGNGETRDFPVAEVPKELWSEDIQKLIK